MIKFITRLFGFKETAAQIEGMPPLFRKTAKHWMFSERKRYQKIFSRQVLKARLNEGAPAKFRRFGSWEPRVAAPFKSMMLYDKPNETSMTIGLGDASRKPKNASFIRRLMLMEQSYPGSEMTSSGKYMTIPVIKNLNALNIGRQNKEFSYMQNAENQLFGLAMIKRGGTVLWFNRKDRMKNGKFKKSGLLFVGKRMVRLRKRLDFVKPWEDRKDIMVDGFIKKINRTLSNVSKGYMSDE